ncbi:hypothetical protein FRC14_001593 [Serendipita sp. 396]|nr:hypothetical protein FRC14_001593 [Serendipita sp. 396]KAG8781572.1 hypothetical protein FRC15_008522 [Serendipita sp. 397]KAG8785999.1 hypothetical protein FRC16_001831 [Serendipita sp. 398]KAG8820696.1 hypothetical protein FRC18_011631 [Serendipita sp. 400]KAG8848850.1 hypothetical protein FRB91_010432 [Serendipita sp. 411]KAG8852100.1 hypothetical protein FRC20_001595 [Serendipita sp. 405]KAG9021401.1 hypothetical protein FS842_006614 [Serendipita sp. 407]
MSTNHRTKPPSIDIEANRSLDNDDSADEDSEVQPETAHLLSNRPQKPRRRRRKGRVGEGKPTLLGIPREANVDPNALVHKIETVFLNFATNSGSSEMTYDQKEFIDDLKKRLLV